jgi:hypothetical protein
MNRPHAPHHLALSGNFLRFYFRGIDVSAGPSSSNATLLFFVISVQFEILTVLAAI